MFKTNKILVILGPTGTGKTKLALNLLKQISGEIISADSRQVYKGIDYATNKIGPKETLTSLNVHKRKSYWTQDSVRINLYDVISPEESFSVSNFVDLAVKHLKRIWRKQQLPIVVGGTGFYLDALLGKSPMGAAPPNLTLRRQLSKLDVENVQKKLRDLDLVTFQKLPLFEKQNKQRLMRYIELASAAGSIKKAQTFSPLKDEIEKGKIMVKKIGLCAERKFIYQKIDQWVDDLIESKKLIQETKKLLKLDLAPKNNLLNGIIFAPCVSFLKSEIDLEEMRKIIRGQLHKYIRRQLIWFRRSKDVEWKDVSTSTWQEKVVKEVVQWYDEFIKP